MDISELWLVVQAARSYHTSQGLCLMTAWLSVKCLSRGFRDFGSVGFGIFAVSQALLPFRVFYVHVWFVGLLVRSNQGQGAHSELLLGYSSL